MRAWAVLAFSALFFALLLFVLVNAAMRKEVNHDEHMYVSAGALLAREGLLPYRDFPYLQMPGLPVVYALLFAVGGSDLLGTARAFSVLCAGVSLLVVALTTYSLLRGRPGAIRIPAAGSAAALVFTNPIFTYTSGLAWNHDMPVALSLLAFATFRAALSRGNAGRWLFLCGLCLGCAGITRLTFAPLLVPFLAACLFAGRGAAMGRSRPVRAVLPLVMGALVGWLPALLLFALSPSRFVFGNLLYHGLNEQYWRVQGYTRAMDPGGKLNYLGSVAGEPGTLVLLLALAASLVLAAAARRGGRPHGLPGAAHQTLEAALLTGITATLLVSVLAPTPLWYQYFYAPVPFLALALVYALTALPVSGRAAFAAGALPLAAACFCLLLWLPVLITTLAPGPWAPVQAQSEAREIAEAVRAHQARGTSDRVGTKGKVLTLAPLYPLEAGLPVYPGMATGPFAWRSALMMGESQAQAQGVVSPGGLEALLDADPPAAALLGYEGALEEPLLRYVQGHGYRPLTLQGGATLWLPRP